MKEFGKRLLIVLSFPLWIVIHIIYYFILMFIIALVILVAIPITYLIIGREPYSDWVLGIFEYSFEKHDNFITKIERL